MAKHVCTTCGVEPQEMKGWSNCPQCERHYCPTCLDAHNKEKRELEKLRNSTAHERIASVCPSCHADMHLF